MKDRRLLYPPRPTKSARTPYADDYEETLSRDRRRVWLRLTNKGAARWTEQTTSDRRRRRRRRRSGKVKARTKRDVDYWRKSWPVGEKIAGSGRGVVATAAQ